MTVLKWQDFLNQRADEQKSRLVFEFVAEGMWPFRLKSIDVYMDFDIDYNEYRVLAGAVLMNGYTIGFEERINAFDFSGDPDEEFLKVAVKMREAFRNREDHFPVPDNIVLGVD